MRRLSKYDPIPDNPQQGDLWCDMKNGGLYCFCSKKNKWQHTVTNEEYTTFSLKLLEKK